MVVFNNYFTQMLFKVTFEKETHILKHNNVKNLSEMKTMIPKVFKVFPKNFYLTYVDEDKDQINLVSESDFQILVGLEFKSAKILIHEKKEDFYDETHQIDIEKQAQDFETLLERQSAVNQITQVSSSSFKNEGIEELIQERIKSILPGIIDQIKHQVQKEALQKSRIIQEQKEKIKQPQSIHKNYTCDGCQMKDIIGARYKCVICNNYDLCQKCQALSDHPHPFLKIKHPSQAPLKVFVVLQDEQDSVEINGQKHQMNGLSNLIQNGLQFAQQILNPYSEPLNLNPQQVKQQSEFKEGEKKTEEKASKEEKKNEEKPQPKKEEFISCQNIQFKINSNASYLVDVLDIKFCHALDFASKYPNLTKEELLTIYFQEKSK